MVFNNFYWKIIIRTLLLSAVLFLLAFCLLQDLYLRSAYVGVLAVALIIELVWFINRFARNVNQFLTSLLQRDFSIHFNEKSDGGEFNKLYTSLNQLTHLFKKISTEKEVQHRYLETLVNHVDVGIISFDEEEKIHLVNKAFLKMVNKVGLTSLKQLKNSEPILIQSFTQLKPNETIVLKLHRDAKIINLALRVSEFKLDDKHYKLISAQDITHELSASEMEAWQKLIRVLTHEIMNSISPIISLSGTLNSIAKKQIEKSDKAEWNVFQSGLEAIASRSEGLHQFTQKYRELTHLPEPNFEKIDLKNFVIEIVELYQSEFDRDKIQTSISVDSAPVLLDKNLMQQALINILKNSLDAFEGIERPLLEIAATRKSGRVQISISDNGPGIEKGIIDKIFVPFFTTKKSGSGIGLALARQIVILHKGELTVESELGRGTTFTITV